MVPQGIPGRLRGWQGSKQRDKAKGSRKEFTSGCALAKRQEKIFLHLPDVRIALGRNPAFLTWATVDHGAVVLVTVSYSLPICRSQEIFQCISGPLDLCLMLGWAHTCSVKAGPGCGGKPQAPGGTGSRQETRASGRGGQGFQSRALRRQLQHKAHSETTSRSLNHSRQRYLLRSTPCWY